jgi:hypothetical protein
MILDPFDPQWRTVMAFDAADVHITVLSKLKYTFTHPDTILEEYRAGRLKPGVFEANRPGELPGSTFVKIEKK